MSRTVFYKAGTNTVRGIVKRRDGSRIVVTPYFFQTPDGKDHGPFIGGEVTLNPSDAYTEVQPPETADAFIAKVIQEVSELPDRTSPASQPDMMLVSAEELKQILSSALENQDMKYPETNPVLDARKSGHEIPSPAQPAPQPISNLSAERPMSGTLETLINGTVPKFVDNRDGLLPFRCEDGNSYQLSLNPDADSGWIKINDLRRSVPESGSVISDTTYSPRTGTLNIFTEHGTIEMASHGGDEEIHGYSIDAV